MRIISVTVLSLVVVTWTWAQGAPRAPVRKVPAAEHVQPLPEGQDLSQITPEDLGWGPNDEAYPDRLAIHKPNRAAMVWVPAGSFTMGAEDHHPHVYPDDVKPPHEVEITHGFWIMRLEVTAAQFCAFLNDVGGHRDEAGHAYGSPKHNDALGLLYFPIEDGEYTVADDRYNWPAARISWYGADAYARHYGMRLPTEAEWEYAARGPESLMYPWGNVWKRGMCADAFTVTDNGPLPVGSIRESRSWCGALDLAGNVAEWVRDWYSAEYYADAPARNPPGPDSGDQRVTRGRSWSANEALEEWRSALREPRPPELMWPQYGFRAVVVPGNDPFAEGPKLIRPEIRIPRLPGN